MKPSIEPLRPVLLQACKTDHDPIVRHRAHVVLLSLDTSSRAAASACGVSERSVTRWRARVIAEGRDGLADRPRRGRPRKLPESAHTLLEEALQQSPYVYGYPVTVWTIIDLTDLLARHGWSVSPRTVYRTVRAAGYVYRRPRHDLRHRQDQEAVVSAAQTLAALQKKGLITPADFASSILTNASSIPTPTWSRSGGDGGVPTGSRRRERTSGSPC